MNAANSLAKSIFGKALAIDAAEERAAYVKQACGGDAALRGEVESLLAALEGAGDFLKRPAPQLAATADPAPDSSQGEPVPASASAEVVGSRIGPYRLVQQLGEGGMGTVWAAEQTEPVKRRVALKVIKPGMDSVQVLRRFEAERQALALMDHTHIAKVFNAGATETGRPYFVMELVKGVPISKYCDQLRLSVRERLALFIPVCQAIQHAHQKGIIHRDIKPSNVLVCMQDGKPVPKVIDFGVAKAVGPQLTEQSMYTEIGQIIGTLEYMSPEQAELSPLDIDTRADVYALGVLLYELLTSTTPLDRKRLKSAAMLEAVRLIREEEPPRPSTRLTDSKESLPTLAAQRRTEPGRLTKEVRGELDWIVMKCLEKDRTRRYETANGLARDIERYLHDEAVEACPPSPGYRLKKVLRRHKGPVVTGAAVFLVLLIGVAVSTWQAVRAGMAEAEALQQWEQAETARQVVAEQRKTAVTERDAKERARAEAEANAQKAKAAAAAEAKQRAVAEAVRDFLQNDLLRQADAEEQTDQLRALGDSGFTVQENPTIKELLNRAATGLTVERIEQRFPKQPLVQAEMLRTVGRTYHAIGEYPKAITHLQRAADLQRTHLGPAHPDTLSTLNMMARAYLWGGNTPEAKVLLEKVRDARMAKLGANHPDTLRTLGCLAWAYNDAGKTAQAIALYEKVRDGFMTQLGPEHPRTLQILVALAWAYRDDGKIAQAKALLEKVRDVQSAKLGPDHPDTLRTLNDLALVYRDEGRIAEAIAILEKIRDVQIAKLGPDHPYYTLRTFNDLALAYQDAGRIAEAIALLEKCRDGRITKLGADHPSTLLTLDNLAGAYRVAGKTAAAIALYEKVRDARITKLGADHRDTLSTLNELGVAYWCAGKLDQSVPLFEDLLPKRIKISGPDHQATLTCASNLAVNYCRAKRLPEATKVIVEWLPRTRAKLGAGHRTTQHAEEVAITIYKASWQSAQASNLRLELLNVLRKELPPDDPRLAIILVQHGATLLKAGKPADAEPVLRECLAILEKKQPDAWTTFHTTSLLGLSLLTQKKYGEAEPVLLAGYEGMKQRAAQIPPSAKMRLTEALQRLVQLYGATGKTEKAAEWQRKLEAAVTISFLERTRDTRITKLGPDHPDTLTALNNLGLAYLITGELDKALPLLEETLATRKAKIGAEHPDTLGTMNNLALAYRQAGQLDRAATLCRELLKLRRQKDDPDSTATGSTLALFGAVLLKQKKYAEAEPVLRDCLKIREKKKPDDWGTSNTRSMLGGALLGQKKFAEAEPLLLAGYNGLKECEAKIPPIVRIRLTEALERLVELYEATGKTDKAAEWRKKLKEANASAHK